MPRTVRLLLYATLILAGAVIAASLAMDQARRHALEDDAKRARNQLSLYANTLQTLIERYRTLRAVLALDPQLRAALSGQVGAASTHALGVGLPYALTVRSSAKAEYIALWFKSIGMETGYYWYVTACIACSLPVYVFMKDTRKHSRIKTD